jgi:hypothetical protein
MQNETRVRWMTLCEQAANEQNPKRLTELVREICKLLDEKQDRLESKNRAEDYAIK